MTAAGLAGSAVRESVAWLDTGTFADCRFIGFPWVACPCPDPAAHEKRHLESRRRWNHIPDVRPRAVNGATRYDNGNVDTKNSWVAWLQVDAALSTATAATHPRSPTFLPDRGHAEFFVATKLIKGWIMNPVKSTNSP